MGVDKFERCPSTTLGEARLLCGVWNRGCECSKSMLRQ